MQLRPQRWHSLMSLIRSSSFAIGFWHSPRTARTTASRTATIGGSPVRRSRTAWAGTGTYAASRTMSSLVATYPNTVLGETSAPAAICSTVVS
ncbi:hypothetical protein [Streptomyces sp. NK08204]|uniref:hypothetical protein n=1 Tax=Streptomyces sp. NK08204 TaxID=2873260 RepID=UPI001CED3AEA|nr:hypothetical protein [Streptomyces sp. NK08204]